MDQKRESTWAARCFGDLAPRMPGLIVAALLLAVENAQDAQDASLSPKRFAYGSALMIRRYETLVETFRGFDDVHVVKPEGAPYELIVVRGNLLFPFRYAEDDVTPIVDARIGAGRISELAKGIFKRFGAKSSYVQESLLDAEEEINLRPVLTHLPDNTRLVPIAYAANAQAGLLKLFWGEAELIDDSGRIRWAEHEEIPFLRHDGHIRDLRLPGFDEVARFDHGEEPDITLSPRPEVERKNEKQFPVNSEAGEEAASTEEDER